MHGNRTRGISLSDATALMLTDHHARSWRGEPTAWEDVLRQLDAPPVVTRSGGVKVPGAPMCTVASHSSPRHHSPFSLPSPLLAGYSPKRASPLSAQCPFVVRPTAVGGGPALMNASPPRFVSVLVPPAAGAHASAHALAVGTPPMVRFMPPPLPHQPLLGAGLLQPAAGNGKPKKKQLHEQAIKYEFAIGNHRVAQMNVSKAAIDKIDNVHMAILNAHPAAPDGHHVVRITGDRQGVNKALRLIRRLFPTNQYPDVNLLPLPPLATATKTGSPTANGLSISPAAAAGPAYSWVPTAADVPLDCTLAAVHSPAQFFLVQHTHPSFPQLELLEKGMALAYGDGMQAPLLPKPVQAGSLCAIMMNGHWCRALVVRDRLVRLVDHGGYVKANDDDLRQIRSDFAGLPFQAIECSLSDLPLTDFNLTGTELFCQLASGGALRATCTHTQPAEGKATVRLEAIVDGQWVDVATRLKEACLEKSTAERQVEPPGAAAAVGVAAEPLIEQEEEEEEADFGGFQME